MVSEFFFNCVKVKRSFVWRITLEIRSNRNPVSLLPGGNGWEQLPYEMDGVLVGNVEETKQR